MSLRVVVLFFAVFAAINLLFRIGKDEDMLQFLLHRCDAAGIAAFDHVYDLFWKLQLLLLTDLAVLDDVDGNVMVDKSQDIQIQHIDGAFYLDDILFAHLAAAGIFDDGHTAVQFIQSEVMVNGHALSGFDMIQDESFVDCTYVQHTFTSSNVRIRAILT